MSMLPPSVSGTVIRANRKAFATILGEKVVGDHFTRDSRFHFWEHALPVEWIELGVVEESVRALAEHVNRDAVGLNVEATRIGTEQSFLTIWRVLLRLTSDDALVARSGTLYGRAFNVGTLRHESLGPGRAALYVEGWREPPAFHMHGLAAGVETMLRLSGRSDARVRYESTGGKHVLLATARPS